MSRQMVNGMDSNTLSAVDYGAMLQGMRKSTIQHRNLRFDVKTTELVVERSNFEGYYEYMIYVHFRQDTLSGWKYGENVMNVARVMF